MDGCNSYWNVYSPLNWASVIRWGCQILGKLAASPTEGATNNVIQVAKTSNKNRENHFFYMVVSMFLALTTYELPDAKGIDKLQKTRL